MRIGLLSLEYPPETGWGGVGTQTRHKARGLAARGHDVHVVSATWDGLPATKRDEGAVLHRIAAPDLAPLACDGPALWIGWSIAAARKLREIQQDRPFDVIQFPEYGGEGFIHQIDDFPNRQSKYSLQLHSPISMFAEQSGWPLPSSGWYKTACFLEQLVIDHSDLVMASSYNTAKFCADKYGCSLAAIHVIHSAVDTDLFFPHEPVMGECWPRILFVGKLSRSKGFPSLVEAVLMLRKKFPRIRLRAVGRSTEPETINKLRLKIENAGAFDNFEFHGPAPYDELPAHYAWCNLFAGPSVNEPGPGNVYLEAAACGRAVVACNTGGTSESVVHEKTGLLVAPDSSLDLANAIEGVCSSPKLLMELGSNGRDWAVTRFALGKYVDRVESLYLQLMGLI